MLIQHGSLYNFLTGGAMSEHGAGAGGGELVHLSLQRVHPEYRGLSLPDLIAALRADLIYADAEKAVAVSQILAGGLPADGPEAQGAVAQEADVALELLEDVLVVAEVDQEIEDGGDGTQLPLIRLVDPTKH